MRKCNCSGHCGPQPLNRREFIGLVGAGAAATLLGTPAWGAFELPADELQRWRRDLFSPAQPRLYYSYTHTDARTSVIREAGIFSYDGSSPGLAANTVAPRYLVQDRAQGR